MKLSSKKCIPCEDKKMKPMSQTAAKKMMNQVPGWELEKGAKKMSRTWILTDFKKALKFVNAVGKIAESEGHHPDMFIWYNKVLLDLWTHSIGGLSENDFIMAAKINELE